MSKFLTPFIALFALNLIACTRTPEAKGPPQLPSFATPVIAPAIPGFLGPQTRGYAEADGLMLAPVNPSFSRWYIEVGGPTVPTGCPIIGIDESKGRPLFAPCKGLQALQVPDVSGVLKTVLVIPPGLAKRYVFVPEWGGEGTVTVPYTAYNFPPTSPGSLPMAYATAHFVMTYTGVGSQNFIQDLDPGLFSR